MEAVEFTDLLVDTGNPEMLDTTMQHFGCLLSSPSPGRYDTEQGHYVLRVFGGQSHVDVIRDIMEQQGYGHVVGARPD